MNSCLVDITQEEGEALAFPLTRRDGQNHLDEMPPKTLLSVVSLRASVSHDLHALCLCVAPHLSDTEWSNLLCRQFKGNFVAHPTLPLPALPRVDDFEAYISSSPKCTTEAKSNERIKALNSKPTRYPLQNHRGLLRFTQSL